MSTKIFGKVVSVSRKLFFISSVRTCQASTIKLTIPVTYPLFFPPLPFLCFARAHFTRRNVNQERRGNEDIIGVTATCNLLGNIGKKGRDLTSPRFFRKSLASVQFLPTNRKSTSSPLRPPREMIIRTVLPSKKLTVDQSATTIYNRCNSKRVHD